VCDVVVAPFIRASLPPPPWEEDALFNSREDESELLMADTGLFWLCRTGWILLLSDSPSSSSSLSLNTMISMLDGFSASSAIYKLICWPWRDWSSSSCHHNAYVTNYCRNVAANSNSVSLVRENRIEKLLPKTQSSNLIYSHILIICYSKQNLNPLYRLSA